jgi:hypothetical protein
MSDLNARRRFDAWLSHELRRPVAIDPDGPEHVMAMVRGARRHGARRNRRATPATGFAFAACLVGVIAFRMATLLVPSSPTIGAIDGAGLRDTIGAFRDSMEGTARLVGVAVVAPAAARIAVVHDFHGWDLHVGKVAADRERGTATLDLAPGLVLHPAQAVSARSLEDSMRATILDDSMPERR